MRWLVVATVLFSWPAWSDGPSPRPLKTTAQPQASSTNPKEDSKVGNQAPLQSPTIIEDTPSLNHHDISDNKGYDRNDYSSSEWWLVYLTGFLSAVTAALAVYTAKLCGATVRVANDAKSTSERQAEETQQALALTKKQISLAVLQLQIVEKQHDLQRWEHVMAHRPKLVIREVLLVEGSAGVSPPNNSRPHIDFSIVNVGGSQATILEHSAAFIKVNRFLPAVPPYRPVTNVIVNPIREAGQSEPVETLYIDDPEVAEIVRSWRGKTVTNSDKAPHYYFFGYVQYADSVGALRCVAFCRRYDVGTKRFVNVEDAEYEYSD